MVKNKVNFFFEYIYFRITQLFFKKQGRTGTTAISLISLMQSLIIILVVLEPLELWMNIRHTGSFSRQGGKIAVMVIFTALFFFNYKRYTGKYNAYRFHWKDESRSKRRVKGGLVVLALLLPLLIFVLVYKYFKV